MIRKAAAIPISAWYWIVGVFARNGQNVLTAFDQIWANKGRSLLTTLGIIIAVMSIITVIALVEGFGNYLTAMLRGYGTQFMVVHPQYPPGIHGAEMGRVTLSLDDIEAVRVECPNVRKVTPFFYTEAEVKYGREKAENIPIRGVTEHYQTVRNFHVDAGRFFGPVDIETGAPVCVLGRTLLKLMECDESVIGDFVYIDDTRFCVVGALESKGSFFGEDQDQTILIPYTRALTMYPEQRESIPFLAGASSEEDIDAAAEEIRRVLRRRHGLQPNQPDDFRIGRQDQALREFDYMKVAATAVLAGIVSISLLVGGIGIMNMMLVSVTERTREIGLRKSIGGRRRDIMLQFLTEAVVLCILGGVIGVGLGYALAFVASLHPMMVEVKVSWWSVALALGFSAATGIIFGIIPAFTAAILHPIDALRHE